MVAIPVFPQVRHFRPIGVFTVISTAKFFYAWLYATIKCHS